MISMNLIVAVDEKWGIGRDGKLLTSIPGDMKYFKKHTTGKVIVMGRKTLESMPGKKGLPNRVNYVMTHDESYEAEDAIVVHSEEELFVKLGEYNSDDVYLIGGASLYNKYYRKCDRLYITKIDAELNADTFIVNVDEDSDYFVASESEPQEENGIKYRFLIYERKLRERI